MAAVATVSAGSGAGASPAGTAGALPMGAAGALSAGTRASPADGGAGDLAVTGRSNQLRRAPADAASGLVALAAVAASGLVALAAVAPAAVAPAEVVPAPVSTGADGGTGGSFALSQPRGATGGVPDGGVLARPHPPTGAAGAAGAAGRSGDALGAGSLGAGSLDAGSLGVQVGRTWVPAENAAWLKPPSA